MAQEQIIGTEAMTQILTDIKEAMDNAVGNVPATVEESILAAEELT